MFAKTFAMMGLASMASAHIIMTNPVPLGSPNSSPLEANGSNFPCKGPVQGGGQTENVYEQGSTQQLAFKGSAVHGGGSCQVSVTTDLNPTKDSVWKVIKSIEGGCPAQDQVGNLPGGSPDSEVPYKYDFTIPQDLAAGDYVFAWSWFNKVGNREMYMNCAAVSVTGSSGSDGFLDTLPDMFVANIENGCSTEEGYDDEFPNPGQNVDRMNGATDVFKKPANAACTGSGGSPAPEPTSAPEPTTAPAPTSAPAPEDPAPSPTSIPGGIFITVTTTDNTAPTEAPQQPDTPETPSPAPEQPETPVPEDPLPEVPVTNPSEGSFTPGTACSDEGVWNCVGGTSFQRCASGTWSQLMGLAAGVSCEGGQSSQLKVNAASNKRSMRRSLRIKA